MTLDIETVGRDWLISQVADFTEEIHHISPTEFNEKNRYLPKSVTPLPGYIRYDVTPFIREIVDCFDVNSPVSEVNVMKGVQIAYSTMLESGTFYFMGHIKTLPMMYMTADKELADARIEHNFIPMINQSGMGHIIRSNDEGNSRKTGKTKKHIQWEGNGYLVPFGARNANKMRQFSICILLKDELDAWLDYVGKDGDPDKLSDDRCAAYWERRKIFRGSTPLTKPSKIYDAYLKGDQRKYMILCISCGFPQFLRWETVDKKTGLVGGFDWDMEDGTLLLDSVRYRCQSCGHPHYEYDKERLFSEDHGAHWNPTAKPVAANIRSYHLPALYSPISMQPWHKCVADYLEGWDPVKRKVINVKRYQQFYNNILGWPFEIMGAKVRFMSVSAHRRAVYRLGQIPNKYAAEHSGSHILFLTCQVDVHKDNLAVTVLGWTEGFKCYLIDYWRFEPKEGESDCTEISSPVWGRLRKLVEETEYTAEDGRKYRLAITFVDARYENATVTTFCSDYESGVYPILGATRTDKNLRISEFGEFTSQLGTVGYKIVVDHYKDRIAPVLRREWTEGTEEQSIYHFNAPVDITDDQLKELTREVRREKVDDKNRTVQYWHRPGNAKQELWDLLVYGYAAVEVLAWNICIQHFELKEVDWVQFWKLCEADGALFARVDIVKPE